MDWKLFIQIVLLMLVGTFCVGLITENCIKVWKEGK